MAELKHTLILSELFLLCPVPRSLVGQTLNLLAPTVVLKRLVNHKKTSQETLMQQPTSIHNCAQKLEEAILK